MLSKILVRHLSYDFLHLQEQWKSSTSSKRRDRSEVDEEEGGHSEKRRRKGGKRRKKDKNSRSRYEADDAEAEMMDDHEEVEDEDAKMNYEEPAGQVNDQDDYATARDPLAAAGLEDSDAEDEVENLLFLCFQLLTMINYQSCLSLEHKLIFCAELRLVLLTLLIHYCAIL